MATEKDKPVTVEVEQTQQPPLMINLGAAGKKVAVKDMNYNFQYDQVILPDGKESDFYTMAFKEDGWKNWMIVNGLLSKEFTICRTEQAIAEISKSLGGELIGERHWRDKTSVKSTFLIKGYTLNITEVSDADKIIFQLLTGVNINEIEQRSALAFHIINGFSGNLALQLNYGFITSHTAVGNSAKLNISNVFVLDEFSHRLIHNGKLGIEYSKVEDVKAACSEKIEKFKRLKPDVELMDGLVKGFPKKFIKSILDIYDQLTDEYKNLYYLTHIVSGILESTKQVNKEIYLRKFISAHVDRLEEIRLIEEAKATQNDGEQASE